MSQGTKMSAICTIWGDLNLLPAETKKRNIIYFCLQFLHNEILPQVVLVEQSDKMKVFISKMTSIDKMKVLISKMT